MRLVAENAQHIGRRSSQQDAFGFSDLSPNCLTGHAGFAAVLADGMGGMEEGGAASTNAVRVFLEAYQGKGPDESVPQALMRSLAATNQAIYRLALQNGTPESMGTTFVAVVFQVQTIWWLSVGDSAVFLFRDQQLSRLNVPHVYAEVLEQKVARGEITADQASADPQRESLTSYVGSEAVERIDRNRRPFPVQGGDRIILASDGLLNSLDAGEIASILRSNRQGQSEKLVQAVCRKGLEAQDNITVLTVGLESEQAAPPAVVAGATAPIPGTGPAPSTPRARKVLNQDDGGSRSVAQQGLRYLILFLSLLAAAVVVWQLVPVAETPAPVQSPALEPGDHTIPESTPPANPPADDLFVGPRQESPAATGAGALETKSGTTQSPQRDPDTSPSNRKDPSKAPSETAPPEAKRSPRKKPEKKVPKPGEKPPKPRPGRVLVSGELVAGKAERGQK